LIDTSHGLADINYGPADINHVPASTSHGLADLNHRQAITSHEPADINHRPADIKHGPADIKHGPADIKHGQASTSYGPADISLGSVNTNRELVDGEPSRKRKRTHCGSITPYQSIIDLSNYVSIPGDLRFHDYLSVQIRLLEEKIDGLGEMEAKLRADRNRVSESSPPRADFDEWMKYKQREWRPTSYIGLERGR